MSNLTTNNATYLLSNSLPDGKYRYFMPGGQGLEITGPPRPNLYEQLEMMASMVSELSGQIVNLKQELADHKRDTNARFDQFNEDIENLEIEADEHDTELQVLSEKLEVHKEPRRKKVKLNVPKFEDGVYSYRPIDNIHQAFLIEMSDDKWSNIVRQTSDGNYSDFHTITHMQLAYGNVSVVRRDMYGKATWNAYRDRVIGSMTELPVPIQEAITNFNNYPSIPG